MDEILWLVSAKKAESASVLGSTLMLLLPISDYCASHSKSFRYFSSRKVFV
jgi:hypothetical protein